MEEVTIMSCSQAMKEGIVFHGAMQWPGLKY